MALKQFSAASADCAESLLLEAGSAKVQLRKARCDLALGEAEGAIGLLSEVLAADPGNATARTEKAQAQAAFRALCELRGAVAEGGSAARVVELTGAALTDRCPASAFVKTARANALLALGRVDEAMALATALLQAASDGGEGGGGISALLLLRARCLNYAGNGASAIKTLTECLRQDPDDPTAARLMKLIKRSEALKKEGNDAFAAEKWDLALEAYRSALALDPLNKNFTSRVLCNCATVLFKQGKFGEAVGECNASLAADEAYVKAYRRRAAAYTSLGDADSIASAIRDMNKAKELLGGAAGAPAASAEASAENKQQLREIEEGLKAAQKALKKAKFKDYYKLLELERNADEDDIRKAYKRAALKWHPDRHSSASEADKVKAEAMFKDVTEANTVLNDPQMRARYDESLSSGSGEAFDPSGSSDGCCGGGGGMRGNPFGGGGGGGGAWTPESVRPGGSAQCARALAPPPSAPLAKHTADPHTRTPRPALLQLR